MVSAPALLAALACTSQAPLGPTSPGSAPGSGLAPTPATIPSGSTGASWAALPASAIVEGLPGQGLDHGVALVDDGDRALLALAGYVELHDAEGLPATLVLDGALPAGTHLVTDLWDGGSGLEVDLPEGFVHSAGDVDDDGHGDVWVGEALYRGPLLGQVQGPDDAWAWFEDEGPVVAAGLDADQDGVEDVVLYPLPQVAVVVYGPPTEGLQDGWLAGTIAADGVLVLGEEAGCHDQERVEVLVDHLGAGHHALAVGESSLCDLDTHVFDVGGPAGASVPRDQALFATDGGRPQNTQTASYDDAGDLDGDGSPDVLYQRSAGHTEVLAGPLLGGLGADLEAHPRALEPVQFEKLAAVGDVDGDGIQELVGEHAVDGDPEDRWWVLLFSPHDADLDLSTGLPLAPVADLRDVGARHGDLDGDGLSDLVVPRDTRTEADPYDLRGEIHVWYGADLVAAREAYSSAP